MEDLSALIFVALAVAWASYLIPKALQHHDDARRTQAVDSFSDDMRVLASREPVSARDARLVVGASAVPRRRRGETSEAAGGVPAETPRAAGPAPAVASRAAGPAPAEASRAAGRRRAAGDPRGSHTHRAARRRRRMLGTLLLAVAAVAAGAAYELYEWVYLSIPGGLLAGWLVACRLMVRRERRSQRRRPGAQPRRAASRNADAMAAAGEATVGAPAEPEPEPVLPAPAVPERVSVALNDQGFVEVSATAVTSSIPVSAELAGSGLWDPVPVTLPTYVTKAPAARRTVRTIDLDASGVWTSGRTEVASALARQAEAEAAEAAAGATAADGRHAVG